MYQSTTAFGNLIQQDSRTFKALITYEKKSITKVKNIKLTGGSEGGEDFSLGSTMSQYIEVTIPDGNILIEGKEILLQIGMDVNGLTEYIPMGYFTVGKPKKADDQITFTAYDRMMNTERTFSMDGTTTNTVTVLKKIADITGVPVVTTGLTAISMKVPKGYSCREVLSYVVQLHGAFAVCNRRGQIELHTYVDSDYKVKPNRYWGNFEHNDYAFDVSKFVCFTGQDKNGKSISISSGSGARSVSFSNPFMTQTALNNILASFKSFSYMPGTLKMMGDPRLDPWDVLTVEDLSGNTYKVPVMKLEWEYDGGLTYSVEAVGLSEEETNADYKGPRTKEMERYYVQLVMINQAMINKLDVDTANITYATIKNLNVVEENVQRINGEIGSFKELTATNFEAANAKIDILDSNYANIKVLLSGGAGIGDLQNIHLTSQNAVIDSALIRSAVMQTVSVADLLTTRSGSYILVQSGGTRIKKRFSISKAKDGKIGLSYDLHCSTLAVRKQKDGKTLIPASITFSATQNDNGLITVDGLSQSYTDISSKYDSVSDQYTNLDAKVAEYKSGVDGLSQNLSQVQSNLKSNYSTTTAMNAAIKAQIDGFSSVVSSTYATGANVEQKLKAADSAAKGYADAAKKAAIDTAKVSTDELLKSYATIKQMQSAIDQKADSITSTVSSTYATKASVTSLESWKKEASQKITDSAIISTVSSSSAWQKKADKAFLISQINQSAESVSISASKIKLEGVVTANNYFRINADGSMEVEHGYVGDWEIKNGNLSANGIIMDASGGFLQFGTDTKKVLRQDTSGTLYYTQYTDDENYSGLLFGRNGIKAYTMDSGVEELWLNDIEPTENYILRFTKKKVTIGVNAVNADTVNFGKLTGESASITGNFTVAKKFTFRDYGEEDQPSNPVVKRRPVASAGTITKRVAYLSSGTITGANGKNTLSVFGQWGSSSYSAKTFYADSDSDIRLKENFRECKVNALEAVEQMKVCSFDWKKSGIHQPLGIVADELEEIDPLLTLGGGYNEDGSMNIKQIDRLLLAEYAIKAIQELSEMVKKQNKRIEELERRLS